MVVVLYVYVIMDLYFEMGLPMSENQVKKSQSHVASLHLQQLGDGALQAKLI